MLRGAWHGLEFLSFGQAGPNDDQNPFWFLLQRNAEGKSFENGDEPCQVNAMAHRIAQRVRTGQPVVSRSGVAIRIKNYGAVLSWSARSVGSVGWTGTIS